MSNPIELPLDEEDRLVDPPLLDLFREEPENQCYVATIVPSDDVSVDETLTVRVSKQSVEGRRISILVSRIEEIGGEPLVRVSHLGGGNFTLLYRDRTVTLDGLDNAASVEVFDRLKQIAVDAEMAYRIAQAHTQRRRPAV